MGHKNKIKPKGIGQILWNDVNNIDETNILKCVKDYCSIEDGSIPSDAEILTIQELTKNPFVKLIYASAHDEGYNSF